MAEGNLEDSVTGVEKDRLSTFERYAWLTALLLFAVAHLAPYFPRYALPHYDYGNVMHVLNYLQHPDLFAGDRLTAVFTNFMVNTAPVYFYGLAHPLNHLLPTKWVLYVIGMIITGLCTYFAGGSWKTRTNLVVATVTVFLLLHTNVSPLEGNRRSFTAFFLLALFWLETCPSYIWKVILTALAAGIYPPAALIMLTYFGLRKIQAVRRGDTRLTEAVWKLAGLTLVFLFVVSPYLLSILFSEGTRGISGEIINFEGTSNFSIISKPIQYNFHSVGGFVQTFFVGIKDDLLPRGPLFRDQVHFSFFLALLILLLIERIVLDENFQFKPTYRTLILAGLLLWGLAHLAHPLIYQPFKYTRLSLLLGLVVPVAENLPPLASDMRCQFVKLKGLRLVFAFLSVWMLGIWLLLLLFPANFSFLEFGGFLSLTWWKFVFCLPVFIGVLIVFPRSWKTPAFRGLSAILLLLTLMILPHSVTTIDFEGIRIDELDGMFKVLRQSPPGTKVAGPPFFYMDFVPAFASRGIYSSGNLTNVDYACDRNRKFWHVYYSTTPRKILNFMNNNDIDFLMVDRKILKNRTPYGIIRCNINLTLSGNPYLDRNFPEATWRLGNRLYVIKRQDLKMALSQNERGTIAK